MTNLELFRRYKATKTIEARNDIVTANLGLAKTIANQHHRHNVPFDDIYHTGIIGLIKAVEKFNPDSGYQFSSYATELIRGEILHYLRDKENTIRPSRGKQPYRVISANFLTKSVSGTQEMIDVLPDKKPARSDISIDVNAAIKKLSLREQTIIRLHFLKEKPYRSIAKILKIHPCSVTRAVRSSIKKLAPLLAEYSDSCNNCHQQ